MFDRQHALGEGEYKVIMSTKIHTQNGILSMADILRNADKNAHYIPNKWPHVKEQRGHTCGLYALDNALTYAFSDCDYPTPPARKDKNVGVVSLREVAKKQKLSAFGEIFDVNAFQKLVDHFYIPLCKLVEVDKKAETEESYTKKIIQNLIEGYTLIVACDLGDKSFPGQGRGLHSHWILIFGYYQLDNQVSFLAAQYGKYYSFNAKSLYLSNKNLPSLNPRAYPYYEYYKTEDDEIFSFVKNKLGAPKEVRYAVGESMEQFRFGLFGVPANPQTNPIKLKAFFKSVGAQASESSSSAEARKNRDRDIERMSY